MDASGKETKSTSTEKLREKLLVSFCVLSAVAICLVIALFVRTEVTFRQMEAAISQANTKDDGKSNGKYQ